MSAAGDVAAKLLAELVGVGVDRLRELDAYVNQGGPAPAFLPELPDFTRNHLELAALERRAARKDPP